MCTGVFSEQSIFQHETVFMQNHEDEKEMQMIIENPKQLWAWRISVSYQNRHND